MAPAKGRTEAQAAPPLSTLQLCNQTCHKYNVHSALPIPSPPPQNPAGARCTKILKHLSVCKHHESPPSPPTPFTPSSCSPSFLSFMARPSGRRSCTEGIDRTCSTRRLQRGALHHCTDRVAVCHWYPAATLPPEVGELHICTVLSTLPITIDNPSA